MSTKLLKTLTRELIATPDFKGRPMMIELKAGDRIAFRLKGKRTRYEVSLHKVYLCALMQSMIEEYRDKMEAYKLKKAAGYSRLRKPRKPTYSMFTRQLREVMSTNIKINLTE